MSAGPALSRPRTPAFFFAMPALSDPKYETFAREVAAGKSKREAAIVAGYSANDAASRGAKLAKRPEIGRRIGELADEAAHRALEKAQVTRERVIEEYCRIAFLDVRQAFTETGELRPITELDEDTARTIAGMEVEHIVKRGDVEEEAELQPHGGELKRRRERFAAAQIVKIKFIDKKGALDSLARYLGMFRDKVEVTGKDGGPIEMEDARKQLADRIAGIAARIRADEDSRRPQPTGG